VTLTERVVRALGESEDLCRFLLAEHAAHDIDDRDLPLSQLETLRRLQHLADECSFLAAQPLAGVIGGRGR
jgi:hypothetical protein